MVPPLMVDNMSPPERSRLMGRIRGKDTDPERRLRSEIWRRGFRYRLHSQSLPGKPDIVLPRWNVVIFVHGCFWHWHEGCPSFRLPKTRREFWALKLMGNVERDHGNLSRLEASGWRVAVIWECAIRFDAQSAASTLTSWIRAGTSAIEVSRVGDQVSSRLRFKQLAPSRQSSPKI